MFDVIVVGGGPVGSHVARRLAENDSKVLVLERKPEPVGKDCCTGIISQECVNSFDIDSRLVLRKLNSAALFSPSGNMLHLHRQEPQAVVIDRHAFDKSMAERAQQAGAAYRFASRVTDIGLAPDRAVVDVSVGRQNQQVATKAVVIAGGFNPGLNERAGLGASKDHVAGAQAEVEASGLEEVEVYFGDMAPGFFSWLVPTSPGTARAGLLARTEPGEHLKKWLRQLAAQGKIASADVKLNYGSIPLKPPARTYGERILAAGDAAGQVKPTTGGGIYYGLLGADIAATVLQQALVDNDLSAKRLTRYQRAWRRKLSREIRMGYWARKLFERLSDKQIDRIFKIIESSGIDEALLQNQEISFDWHSRAITDLLKYQMITRALKLIKLPFGRH